MALTLYLIFIFFFWIFMFVKGGRRRLKEIFIWKKARGKKAKHEHHLLQLVFVAVVLRLQPQAMFFNQSWSSSTPILPQYNVLLQFLLLKPIFLKLHFWTTILLQYNFLLQFLFVKPVFLKPHLLKPLFFFKPLMLKVVMLFKPVLLKHF